MICKQALTRLTTKILVSSATAVAAALATTASFAQTDGIAACRALDNDALRLACYDELFGRASEPNPKTPPATVAPAADEDFGKEHIKPESVDRVEARLVGVFDGWHGRTVFELDNGQVWRQQRNNQKNYTPREPIAQPRVTIEKSRFGSYKLRVEGVNRIVLVKRVK